MSTKIGKLLARHKPLRLDIDALIETKLAVQANSGGGKSNTLRLLAEVIGRTMPFFFIDPEGEFSTLRTCLDLVVVGEGGELAASVKNAGELAVRLLEKGVSAVIDLYDLTPKDRRAYVAAFVRNLIAAPRHLWKPMMVFVDEFDMFCPETARSGSDLVSTEPMIELMTLSRKRGFGVALATQRISKINKDALAPVNNYLLGRASLDVDYKRAGEILGLDKESARRMRELKRGQFYAFGPAFRHDGVEQAYVNKAESPPPKSGLGRRRRVPRPSNVIRAIIPSLAALAKSKDPNDVNTVDAARERIAVLNHELVKAQRVKPQAAPVLTKTTVKQVKMPHREVRALALKIARKAVTASRDSYVASARKASQEFQEWWVGMPRPVVNFDPPSVSVEDCEKAFHSPVTNTMLGRKVTKVLVLPDKKTARAVKPVAKDNEGAASGDDGVLPKGERAILTACAMYEGGINRKELVVHTGYKVSARTAYTSRLKSKGLIEDCNGNIAATAAGLEALGDFEPLPTGNALLEWWRPRLPSGECKILDVVLAAHPEGLTRDEIGEQTDYKVSARTAYVSRLRSKRLLTDKGDRIVATETLFDAVGV